MIVVDSSVIVNALVSTPQTMEVQKTRSLNKSWYAPALWRSEIRSALLKHLRAKTFTLTTAIELFLLAEELVTNTVTDMPSDLVLALASESGCSAYDCEFVAMAKVLNCPLLTYDKKLLKTFSHIAITPHDFIESRR